MGIEQGFPCGSTSAVIRYAQALRRDRIRTLARHISLWSVFVLCVQIANSARSEQSLVKRGVLIDQVDGVFPFRIILEVDPAYLMSAETALGPPTLFIGGQAIFHTFSYSGTMLEGFVATLPEPTDTIWFARGFSSIQEGREEFDASGLTPLQVDINALLLEGERRRKRIINVNISTESLELPEGPERTLYIVKLAVENCTQDNFAEPGPGGVATPPAVHVGEEVAARTFFSVEEQVVVGEFDNKPDNGAEITLRYAYWWMTARDPFLLP